MKQFHIACLIGLCVFHLAILVHAARVKTVTHDEYWHLPIGLAMWQQRRFDFDVINPPLPRLFAAVPLLPVVPEIVTTKIDHESEFGDRFLEWAGDDYQWYLSLARMMAILWSVTGVILCYFIAKRLLGPEYGLLAAFFWTVDPQILAHGSLVTHDQPIAVMFLASVLTTINHISKRTWGTTISAGFVFGLTALTKFSALVILPPLLTTMILLSFITPEQSSTHRKKTCLQFSLIVFITWFVINCGYLWQGSFLTWGSLPVESDLFQSTQNAIPNLPLLLPKDYFSGVDRLLFFAAQPQPVFLDGQWSLDGFKNYYLMCWLYKVPHSVQLLFLVGTVSLIAMRKDLNWIKLIGFIAFPLLLLTILASLNRNQLGFRYLQPIYPCSLLIAVAGLKFLLDRFSKQTKRLFLTFIIVLSLASLRYHPHHLAYFNEFAGGPEAGRYHLIDSNLDWGQDLNLMTNRKRFNHESLKLAYFGTYPPKFAGLEYELPPPKEPQPGTYAISANYLMGRPHRIRLPEGGYRATDIEEFGYFRFFEPIGNIGYSIYLFELTEEDVVEYQRFMSQ